MSEPSEWGRQAVAAILDNLAAMGFYVHLDVRAVEAIAHALDDARAEGWASGVRKALEELETWTVVTGEGKDQRCPHGRTDLDDGCLECGRTAIRNLLARREASGGPIVP